MSFIGCYMEAVCPDTRDNSALREYKLEKPGWMATIQERPSSYVRDKLHRHRVYVCCSISVKTIKEAIHTPLLTLK